MRMTPVTKGVNVHTKIDKKVHAAIARIAAETAVDKTVVYNTVLKRGLKAVGARTQTTRRKNK